MKVNGKRDSGITLAGWSGRISLNSMASLNETILYLELIRGLMRHLSLKTLYLKGSVQQRQIHTLVYSKTERCEVRVSEKMKRSYNTYLYSTILFF